MERTTNNSWKTKGRKEMMLNKHHLSEAKMVRDSGNLPFFNINIQTITKIIIIVVSGSKTFK